MSDLFQPREAHDVSDLIATCPLAWVVSPTDGGLRGTTLPLLAHVDAKGAVASLEGHFARSNPQLSGLRENKSALVLFLGANSYISPSWVRDRTWAPTWNFAHAQFEVELDFFEAPQDVEAHLRKLVDAVEQGRPNAWSADEMGSRFSSLARGVIGFSARVIRAEARFKLGQDERPEIFADICDALAESPLSTLMRQQRGPLRVAAGDVER